jgi:hypothetical protein
MKASRRSKSLWVRGLKKGSLSVLDAEASQSLPELIRRELRPLIRDDMPRASLTADG